MRHGFQRRIVRVAGELVLIVTGVLIALFYLDLPGTDYVLSPAAAALREQVDLLMMNANTPRQLQVVKDLMDYTAMTWARQDLRGIQATAGLGTVTTSKCRRPVATASPWISRQKTTVSSVSAIEYARPERTRR